MEYIPHECKLHKCFEVIISEYFKGTSWDKVRQIVLNRFGHPDFTNVVQNVGFILIALLYGKGDMRNTINIALSCGYDTDCTCASAASIVGIITGYDGLGDVKDLIKDYFVCGIDVQRSSDSIKKLAEDSVNMAIKMPNKELVIDGMETNCNEMHPQCIYPTKEKLEQALHSVAPVKWEIYGPYYSQLKQEINHDYPSPHGEGSVLPDLVCMVNNEVFLDREYEKGDRACTIAAYEDLIELDKYITMEGQYACVAETTIISDKNQKVWAVVGNNDGFALFVNGQNVLERDEMRLWTPYNNFCLIDLKEGQNRIKLKLLKRSEIFKFSIGFRCYDGNHWHRSKWCTDLKY